MIVAILVAGSVRYGGIGVNFNSLKDILKAVQQLVKSLSTRNMCTNKI
jgi:chorismate mutase